METRNKENYSENLFLQDTNREGIIQALFQEDSYNINECLVELLQHGYQITHKDRETMRDKCGHDVYKRYATLSRLSFSLYQKGHSDLIPKLFSSFNTYLGAIYTIESLISNKSAYFDYKTNVWVCIANNAITHYRDYWIFCEAALKKYGKWEEVYQTESFRKKYDEIDKNAILQWKYPEEYEILKLLYPQLEVAPVHFQNQEDELNLYSLVNSLIKKSDLVDTLTTFCINIEKQRPVWGYHDIAGKTAEEKIYSLWNALPHKTFFDSLLYMSDYKYSSILLELLIKYAEYEVKDAIYDQETLYKLRIGLESGRTHNPSFLLLLWELGYRHHTLQEWTENDYLTSAEKIKLYSLDKLYANKSDIDLNEIMDNVVIRVICLIEDIKNNRLLFTGKPNWKSRINGIRSLQNNPLNNYWGYVDIALDGYHVTDGQSMRNYLSMRESGIKLEKKNETVNTNSNLYKALSILYPEIYK